MTRVADLLHLGRDLPGDSGQLDAEVLLAHCLQRDRTWLYTWPEAELESPVEERFLTLLQQRREGRPVAYLVGRRDFWSLDLAVNESTLIPRPETETLVEWALQLPLPPAAQVVDRGTGSGAIALALASERAQWTVTATDWSAAALECARGNARALGLERVGFVRSNWVQGLASHGFDLVVSNPPYIASADPHLRQGDVRFEPTSALASGVDGLDDLRCLALESRRIMHAGSWLLLEHGYDQGPAVHALLLDAGLQQVETRQDLAGHDRVTGGCIADE